MGKREANAGGLRRWTENVDGEGNPGWEDWYDEETEEENPEVWLENKNKKGAKNDGTLS